MKRFVLPILLTGALLAGCSDEKGGQNPEEPEVPAQEEPAVKPYTDVEPLESLKDWSISSAEKEDLSSLKEFAFRLNKAMSDNYATLWPGDGSGNYSFSPLSISVYLSALSQCVDGQAREDICAMLGMSEKESAELCNKLLRYLTKNDDVLEVSLANSIWHVPGMPVLDSFKQKMASLFGAPVNALDLYSQGSLDVLNAWGSDKTRGMIPEFLTEAPNVDFMIANALYFSGDWINPFFEELTTKEVFHGLQGDTFADLMHKRIPTIYANIEGTEFVELDLPDYNVMHIIMPADMATFAKEFNESFYQKLEESVVGRNVILSLPRFSDERSARIETILKTLGFPGYNMSTLEMTGTADYPLSSVFTKHVSSVNVNEKGVKFAAVTGGTFFHGDKDINEVEMIIDRPFYYIIRNNQCGAILLMGRVNNL